MTESTGTRFIGLDVHKREVTYCILDADGTLLSQRRFELDRATSSPRFKYLGYPAVSKSLGITDQSPGMYSTARIVPAEILNRQAEATSPESNMNFPSFSKREVRVG